MNRSLRDKVVAKTGSGFIYEGVEGEIIGCRIRFHDDEIEYQVRFPQRPFSEDEINTDRAQPDNISWLLEKELA